ncbi:MAG: gamma carbonic anhydrase family protein [Solobacterium sp.]|nr:gamma carbonic anhydrase family protein [Solobacterium sp.]
MVFVAEGARIIGDVTFQEDCSVWYNAVIRGDDQPIFIGNRVNIQDNCTLHAGHRDPIVIEDDVTIGHGAILHGCTVQKECLIGMGAILLDGCVIPPRCIVAAGALVPQGKTFPEGSLIMGSPARDVRPLSDAEIQSIRLSARHYIQCAKQQLELR